MNIGYMNNTTNFKQQSFPNFTIILCGQSNVLHVYFPSREYNQTVNAIFLVLINFLGIFVAAIGNGLVLLSLIRSKLLKGPAYVLTGILCALDFLVAVVLQPLFLVKVGYPIFKTANACNIYVSGFITLTGLTKGSITILALIALERFFAVTFPLKYKIIATNFRVTVAVCFVLTISFGIDVFARFTAQTLVARILQSASIGVSYLIMVICYLTIIIVVKAKKGQFLSRVSSEITKTLALASIVCGLCWIPFIFTLPLLSKMNYSSSPNNVLNILNTSNWTMTFVLLNSAINVGLYCYKNSLMRQEICLQVKGMYSRISSKFRQRKIGNIDTENNTSSVVY